MTRLTSLNVPPDPPPALDPPALWPPELLDPPEAPYPPEPPPELNPPPDPRLAPAPPDRLLVPDPPDPPALYPPDAPDPPALYPPDPPAPPLPPPPADQPAPPSLTTPAGTYLPALPAVPAAPEPPPPLAPPDPPDAPWTPLAPFPSVVRLAETGRPLYSSEGVCSPLAQRTPSTAILNFPAETVARAGRVAVAPGATALPAEPCAFAAGAAEERFSSELAAFASCPRVSRLTLASNNSDVDNRFT